LCELERLGCVFVVSLLERTRLQVPVRLVNEMSRVDTGSVEYRNQPLEMGLTFTDSRHFPARERLIEEMRRNCRGHGENFRHESRHARAATAARFPVGGVYARCSLR
jgi:hypothetical protein